MCKCTLDLCHIFSRKWTTKERPRFKRGKRSKEQSGTPSSVKEEVSVYTKPELILGVSYAGLHSLVYLVYATEIAPAPFASTGAGHQGATYYSYTILQWHWQCCYAVYAECVLINY